MKQKTVSGNGISWAICKCAPCSRQITMPAPHHSVFTGRMPFLLPNQQRQSTLLYITNNSKPVGNSSARQAHMVMQTDEKVENTTPLPRLQDGQEHKMTSGIYHQCALYLIRSRNMTSICSLVDGRVSQHGRNVLILAIEMSRHNPSLRKPDLTSKVEHTIGMFHLAQLLQ